jgi:hypothetical protein
MLEHRELDVKVSQGGPEEASHRKVCKGQALPPRSSSSVGGRIRIIGSTGRRASSPLLRAMVVHMIDCV